MRWIIPCLFCSFAILSIILVSLKLSNSFLNTFLWSNWSAAAQISQTEAKLIAFSDNDYQIIFNLLVKFFFFNWLTGMATSSYFHLIIWIETVTDYCHLKVSSTQINVQILKAIRLIFNFLIIINFFYQISLLWCRISMFDIFHIHKFIL